ncbi:MAG: zf-TFIIB domain-containing protein [Planctomycetota bacterium]
MQVPALPSAGPCPVCGRALAVQQFFDWPVRECAGCAGIWILETTLNKVIRENRVLPDAAAPVETIDPFARAMRQPLHPRKAGAPLCPQCGQALRRQIYRGSGVPVGQCYPCMSLFLDPGTLNLIYQYMHSPRRAAYKAEIEKIFKDIHKTVLLEAMDRNIPPGGPPSQLPM